MSRLLATIRWHLLLQYRNGFLFAIGFFVLVWAALLRQFPRHNSGLELLLSGLMLLSVIITAYYFIGAQVLLEKGERTLSALVVTPLRDREYLLAKVCAQTLLATVESTLLVLLVYGWHLNLALWIAGIILLGAFYTLLGFIVIARCTTFNNYLLPSGGVIMLMILPLINHFGIWQSWLFYLHPVQPMLTLLRAAFLPASLWELLYGLLGALCWLALAFVMARRAFNRSIVRTALA